MKYIFRGSKDFWADVRADRNERLLKEMPWLQKAYISSRPYGYFMMNQHTQQKLDNKRSRLKHLEKNYPQNWSRNISAYSVT